VEFHRDAGLHPFVPEVEHVAPGAGLDDGVVVPALVEGAGVAPLAADVLDVVGVAVTMLTVDARLAGADARFARLVGPPCRARAARLWCVGSRWRC
jgi:hypothetical protein